MRSDYILPNVCGDYLPVLAIEDDRLQAWIEDCEYNGPEILEELMQMLYPNHGWMC